MQQSIRGRRRCAVEDSGGVAGVDSQGMPLLTTRSRDGVSVQGSGMGASSAEYTARMTAVGPITVGELIDTFSQQLVEQVWVKQSN